MTIKVFYNDDLSITSKSPYPIPTERKAAAFVKALGWDKDIIYHGLVEYYDKFDAGTEAYVEFNLRRVHSKYYFENAKPGWGQRRNALAHNTILFKAVNHAQLTRGVAFAPVSGFHHAGHDYGWGFCTFNGLVATALELQGRVLILDGDQHEGDGSIDIIDRLGLSDRIHNHSIESWDDIPDFEGYDHIIYQAGADSHYLDGGYLNDETWVKRDTLVFTQAKEHNVPITVTFAGGYSALGKVVDLHLSTYWTATEVYYGREFLAEIRREIALNGGERTWDLSASTQLALYGELARDGGAGLRGEFHRHSEQGLHHQQPV
jgi:acetoin utilization deacetylase AcuC-like enzyme